MHPNIESKVAVVTGGSRGIGLRIAEALVENGAKVVISSRTEADVKSAVETLNGARKGAADGIAADVREYRQMEGLMHHAERKFGGIDILVNNAGIGIFRSVDEITPEEWDAVIGTNLSGPFYCIRAAVPALKRRGGGYIFNISSL